MTALVLIRRFFRRGDNTGTIPLVIISHGNSGSLCCTGRLAAFAAKNGYIVAMLEHYGNNRNNNELEKR
jgi:predicted dienelactone hydrolase